MPHTRDKALAQAEQAADAGGVEQMVEAAMQQAMQAWHKAQGNGNGQAAEGSPAAEVAENGEEDRFDERGYKLCRSHNAWMKHRSNSKGTWYSHWLEAEKDYCKSK